MDWREKQAEAKKLFEQAKAILSDKVMDGDKTRTATAEEKANVEQMLEDAKRFKAEAGQLKEIEMSALDLDKEMDKVSQKNGVNGRHQPEGTNFKSMGEMLQAIQMWAKFGERNPNLKWLHDRDGRVTEVKDLAEAVGATGGFLVPTEFQAQLYAVMAEQSFVRQRATIIPMRRRQIPIPVLDQTGTTAGRPHWFGGMVFYWAEEAAEKTETDPNFREINLVAHKLIGYTRASDELVEDSAISLEGFLMGELGFVGGAMWNEEYAFLRGSGAGQPLGVVNAGATIGVGRAAANNIRYADLVNMLESFLPSGNGMWVAHQSTMSNLMQMQDQAGGVANTGTYIWGSAADGVPARLLGYPILFTEKLPRIGSTGDIILVDWRYYLIGDRKAATVESTQFDRWRYDQTSWRMVHRVDGQPWLSAPLTLQDGTSQVSPMVQLSASVST